MKVNFKNIRRGCRLVRMLDFDPNSTIGPLSIDIAVTSHCNYQCAFCGTHSYKLKSTQKWQTMDEEILANLLVDLKHLGTRDLLFAGNGEPFLSEALIKLIGRNEYFNIEVMTNGSMLHKIDPELFNRIGRITVSLNSGNGKSHQLTHGYQGQNQFNNITGNIQRLLGYPHGSKKIELNYVITSENKEELPEFIELAKSWEVTYHARQFDTRAFEKVPAEPQAKQLSACYIGFIQPAIMADGKVLQCCGYVRNCIGNLHQKTFKEIWQSKLARETRFKAAAMEVTGQPLFQDCYNCPNALASSARFSQVYSRMPFKVKHVNEYR